MLELKNISYEVDDDNDNKEILKNVNLTIDEHFVAITGPNGGGKSTLARIIAGIHRPAVRSCLTEKTLQISALLSVPNAVSALLSSSRSISRD